MVGILHVSDALREEELVPLYSFFFFFLQSGAYTEVVLYFNYFKNSIVQMPTALSVFPLSQAAFQQFIADVGMVYSLNFVTKAEDFLIEPSKTQYIAEVRRQIRNYLMLSALVQNKTGEHASRMIAMKNAKDNATTFVKQLTLTFNKARQGAITQEISEIVSAKIAIE